MKQDPLQQSKEHYADARDSVREQYDRIKADFRFSNPAAPEQWDAMALTARKGRPMHTLDRTNQYIQHVVNTIRAQKTSAQIFPVDNYGDVDVAQKITGLIRHIEYTSRADIAWATAADHQVRGGLGWIRVTPKVVHSETNEQEILIQRIIDPTACLLEAGWSEPDGSDANKAWIETTMTKKAFERAFPKAKLGSWDSEGWFGEDSVRICEYFCAEDTVSNKLTVAMPDGQMMDLGEDEYWAMADQIGFKPSVTAEFKSTKRVIKWLKMTGSEILVETVYPSQFIGLVPVLGHELWVENKRYLCGMVRRLMDGQRLHNYEMSALTESLMAQPKAPFLLSARAVEGREDEWQRLNSGNPAYMVYNDMDDEGQPINAPTRLAPPSFPAAYANSANLAVLEMEAAVGLPKPSLGLNSNAISGRAKLADKEAGSTATYHFSDNLRVSEERVYRVILDMLPTVYSGRRQAKILGEDDKQSTVGINDEMQAAAYKPGGKVAEINLGVGRYDVRIKVGPSYTTIREEMGVKLQELGKGNPVLASALLPVLMKMSDMPEADKIARVAMAMLPPEVRAAYSEEESAEMPASAKAAIGAKDQELEQVTQALDQAGKIIEELHGKANEKTTEIRAAAQSAMAEIDAAKSALQLQAETLKQQKRELDSAARIADLELKLATAQAEQRLKDMAETERCTRDAHTQQMREFEHQQATDQKLKQAEASAKPAESAQNQPEMPDLQFVMDKLNELMAYVTAPVSIVRVNGKAVGVEKAGQVRQIEYDAKGQVTGVT